MKKLYKKIAVLIMIGGQSKRMGGGIKSYIKFNNKNIFDRILEKIEPQINHVVINCNEQKEKLKKYQLPIISDVKSGYLGPLAGIHAGLNWIIKKKPQIEWLITLPGDTPFIPSNLISCFATQISKDSKIILVKSNKKTHPIIGAWHKSLFMDLDKNLKNGPRKILDWAELHPLEFINFKIKNYDPFFNINTKEDLEKAKIIERDFFSKKNE